MEKSHTSPVQHFARRQMTFPKSLLGYQMEEPVKDLRFIHPQSPNVVDIPRPYRKARAVHICPLDFTSQSQLIMALKGGSIGIVSLDPAPMYMSPVFWKEVRVVLQGVTVFHPSEDELRALFWGETNDLWEMAQTICNFGCEIVVIKRGALGQFIYDKNSKRKWELPAYSARVVDPTGAGDAFCGGYLAGLLKTNDPIQAAFYGSVSASLAIEGSGPFYSLEMLPGLAEARLNALQSMVRAV
jgi:sugar/nucleoside kinase (ribokinase family)